MEAPGRVLTLSRQRTSSSWITGLIIAMLVAACATLAYFWEFQYFSGWDDEGYLMMTVKQFLQGHTLYDEVYTQYGPLYYVTRWIIFRLTGAPVTNDSVRLLATGIWVLYACFGSWAIYRFCRSFSMTILSFVILSFGAARVLRYEPGHPNDLSGLLLLVIILAATLLAEKPSIALPVIAFFCMAGTLIKVNTGLYFTLGVLLALLPCTKSFPFRRTAYCLLAAACLVLPTVLMRERLFEGWVRGYAFMVTAALSSAFVISAPQTTPRLITLRTWVIAGLVSVLFGILVVGAFLATGSSWHAMLYCSVLQHIHTARGWYVAVVSVLQWHSLVFMTGGLGLAIWVSRDPVRRGNSALVTFLKLTIWIPVLLLILASQGQFTFAHAPAFLWLALVPPDRDSNIKSLVFRRVLVFTTLMMLLFAYPVAGDHVDVAILAMVIAFVVCFHDGLRVLESGQVRVASVFLPRRFDKLIAAGAVVLLIAITAFIGHRYEMLTPVELRGAKRVRVPREEASTYERLVQTINADCKGFITMPGMLSLNFWTGQEPPNTINLTDWYVLLDSTYQQEIIQSIQDNNRGCVVENDSWVEWWRRGQDLNKYPLVVYIRHEYRPYATVGDYQILIRRDNPTLKRQQQ